MLNKTKLKNIRQDNSSLLRVLLLRLEIYSDSPSRSNLSDLLDTVEEVSLQLDNLTEVIEYLLEEENE
jgi:hypothetical protein